MLLNLQAYVITAENDDGSGFRYEPNDIEDEAQETTIEDGRSHGGEFVLTDGQSITLDMGGIEEVHGFWIRATGDFDMTMTINSIVDPVGPVPIRRVKVSTSLKARVLMETLITALSIVNAMTDASTIRGTYRVWGNAAA